MTAATPEPVALSPRDLDLHLNARSSSRDLHLHLVHVHGIPMEPLSEFAIAWLMDRHRAAHGPAEGYAAGLSDRLRTAADEAHGEGLRRAGYNAALDDVSILLAEEVERLEGLGSPRSVKGIRWALGAIKGMR